MTRSQMFKRHVRGLANAAANPKFKGSATAQRKLAEYHALGRVGAFQKWCDEHLQPEAEIITAEQQIAFLLGDEPEVGVQVEAPAKPKRTRKTRKAAGVKPYTFRKSLFNRYGIKPKVGSTFKTKRGNTLRVTKVTAEGIEAERA